VRTKGRKRKRKEFKTSIKLYLHP